MSVNRTIKSVPVPGSLQGRDVTGVMTAVHIMPVDGGKWLVRRSGRSRIYQKLDRLEQVSSFLEGVSLPKGTEVIIHSFSSAFTDKPRDIKEPIDPGHKRTFGNLSLGEDCIIRSKNDGQIYPSHLGSANVVYETDNLSVRILAYLEANRFDSFHGFGQ